MKIGEIKQRRLDQSWAGISDQGVWFSWPSILDIESTTSNLYDQIEILMKEFKDEERIVDRVFGQNSCMFKLPRTFPLLSSDVKHEIKRMVGKSVSGYQVEVETRYGKTSLYSESKQRIAIRHSISVSFYYCTGELSETLRKLVCSLGLVEATIFGNRNPQKVTYADISLDNELVLGKKKPIEAKYKVILMNDSTIPFVRTGTAKSRAIVPGARERLSENLYFNSHGPMIHEQKNHKTVIDIVIDLINGEVPRDKYEMYRGVNLCSIGISFPLDKNPTFCFIFFRRRR